MIDLLNRLYCSPNMRCNFCHNVKGQAVVDFLAEHPDSRVTKFYEDLPDEVDKVCMTQTTFKGQLWQLFFDGASRTGPRRNIVAPQNYVIPRAFLLTELGSNNVAEKILS